MPELASVCARRAELLRELAELEEALAGALAEAARPEPKDEVLSLEQAAAYLGEPARTVRDRAGVSQGAGLAP